MIISVDYFCVNHVNNIGSKIIMVFCFGSVEFSIELAQLFQCLHGISMVVLELAECF